MRLRQNNPFTDRSGEFWPSRMTQEVRYVIPEEKLQHTGIEMVQVMLTGSALEPKR